MRVFYTAKSFSGETKSGEMNVKDERDLATQLRADGFMLTSYKSLEEKNDDKVKVSFLDRFSKIPVSEKMMFARNLSIMISSGLPLSRAVKNITMQTKNKRFKKVLTDVQEGLQGGNTFADSLARYPGIFDELFVNMVRVGEASGNLEEVLNILAGQLEKEHDLISKVKGAMTYPAVILVAMTGIGILMMIYVVPQITSVFAGMGVEVPPTTKFIMATSDFMRNHYIIMLSGMVVVVVGVRILAAFSFGKKFFGMLSIRIPVVSNIVIKMNCARFARIYSSLLKSGVSVVEALKILSRTLPNYYYKRALIDAAENIQKGVNLSTLFYKEKRIFPILVPQMIEVGEETGKTDVVLLKLAEFYEEEVDQRTKNLSSIIEPVLMIIIGSAVGLFAISIIQPMYSMMNNIN